IGVLCATAHSPCICSRLRVALRFAQQPTGLTLPFGALMISLPSQISAFCALTARSPCICSLANIGVLRADRAQPSYLLTPPGRFGPSAQVPTGHTLPSGAPAGRFAAFGGNSPPG